MRLAPLALVLAMAACAGAQHPADPSPVGLGAWCEEVTATLCHATADKCYQGKAGFEAGCQEAARTSCLGGRDRALASGRTGDELRACVTQLKKLDCSGLSGKSEVLSTTCAAKSPTP